MTEPDILLHLCTTCRAGTEPVAGQPVPGQILHDRLQALLSADPVPPVRLRPVECLAVCQSGCTASIAQNGKWSYLLGRLSPDKAADLLVFARAYASSRTGTVMPSKRPASLADMILGRIPAPTVLDSAA